MDVLESSPSVGGVSEAARREVFVARREGRRNAWAWWFDEAEGENDA
jgi:hypothetical protein